eukprot:TRINITY_DN2532_c0_g1_i1.p1 TRINITY_DN2532_c0_g1~~TRINITY_DN2532_c0_g1_i1.p1  ORF type:complete len:235 (-),score=28.47 TRINITY_DN2532_c0_g1_i1:1307-2011(-)
MLATRCRGFVGRAGASVLRHLESKIAVSPNGGRGLAIARTSNYVEQEVLSTNKLWPWTIGLRQYTSVGAGSGGRSGGLAVRNPPDTFPFAVKGLNHIAIAVPNLGEAAEHYRTVFGAQVSEPLDQPDHGVTVVFVHLSTATIELLHPLGDNSPIAKFLEKNPKGGLHHLCLTVDDIHSASNHMQKSGVAVLGNGEPKLGAHNNPVLFLHPKDNNGVLFELEQVSCAEKEKDIAA